MALSHTRRILVLTFLESFATILVEKAAYFYCHERLGFTDAANLWLALAFGAAYVVGATGSHRLARRLGERSALLVAVGAQLLVFGAMALWPVAGVMFVCGAAMGMLCGLKWPVIESYVSAGHTPAAAAKALGRFNLSWAAAVPLSLVAAGPLIAWQSGAMFVLGSAISLLSVALILTLPPRPEHLPADHPERPSAEQTRRLEHLTRAARWQMLANYSAMWVLATLLPGIFDRLGFAVSTGTALSSLLDVARLTAFAVLGFWAGWHGRRTGLVRSMGLLTAGFLMVLFGGHVAVVLAGEVLFGWAVGEVYYAALYYAVILQNASVEAGGGHERLIGLGFAVGPAAGLIGVALQPVFGGQLWGILAVAGLLLGVCFWRAGREMARVTRSEDGDGPANGT